MPGITSALRVWLQPFSAGRSWHTLDLQRYAGVVLNLNLMLARERLPFSIRPGSKKKSEVSREALLLPQSKIT
jgi:hypothetical protein